MAPSDSLAMAQKGAALLGLERYEDALAYTDRALAGDSDTAWIWNNRGIALTRLGQQKEARAAFDNAMVVATERSGY
jgi:Flp pilus assembly protein TadD